MNKFEKDVKIDIDSLEEEWLKQPSLYFEYAKQMEDLANEVRQLELKVDIIRAQLDNQIRDTHQSNDDKKKLTEKMIEAMILQDSLYQDIVKQYNDKKYELNIVKGAVEALNQKKSALENLVKLWMGGYYATPSQSNVVSNKGDWNNRIEEHLDSKIVKNLNKKRR